MPSLEPLKSAENPHVAGLLAVHLVSQVLEEAYVIANAANESGQPWRYLSMLKNLRSGKLGDADEEISFVASNGDSVVNENKEEHGANVVATSTPQKLADSPRVKTENSLIGQGDEEFDTNELSKSTSIFINHLFDMSEVERVICDDTEILQSNSIPKDMLTQAMTKIMESYVNNAFNIAFGQELDTNEAEEKSSEQSCYSFLADALCGEYANDIAFFIDEDATSDNSGNHNNAELSEVVEDAIRVNDVTEIIEAAELIGVAEEIDNKDDSKDDDRVGKNDVAFYENTYLTLNRDYEQCSDDEGEPVIRDPKGMMLQEVELLTANSSEEDASTHCDPLQEERKELAAVSGVSGVSSRKSKSSLISRCRSQGARLLSCLRGWWRRKTPGKRREAQTRGPMRGICPLSPDARRRAASLLDHRDLYSPTPSRAVVWKFNTVNESLVKSSHWKDYTFEVKPEECGEYP